MHFSIWLHERCGALILLPPQHDTVCFEPGQYWAEQHSNVQIGGTAKKATDPDSVPKWGTRIAGADQEQHLPKFKPQRLIHHGEEVQEDVRGDQPGDSGSGAV